MKYRSSTAAAAAALTAAATAAALTAAAIAVAPAAADHHAGVQGYALANAGDTLVVMADLAKPGEIATLKLAKRLDAIAFRPVTGDLLGVVNGSVMRVDPATGALTDLGARFMDDAQLAAGAQVGFDFNNKIDAARAVSTEGDNLVYFPAGFGDGDAKANTVRRFTSLAYAEGDANAGAAPMVFANAYTNAVNGAKAGATLQYALDAGADALTTLANNSGTLMTVGSITIDGEPADIAATGGFDIVSPEEGANRAYAILQIEGRGAAALYALDLETASAVLIADLGLGAFSSFAAAKTR